MLEDLLLGIVSDPQDEDRYLVLADWLEEYDDPRRAELLRLHRRLLATCCEPDGHPERAAWQARIVELLAEGVRPCVPQRTVDLGGGVAMTFSFVPPGSFLMGSPPQEEGRQDDERRHRVTLTRGFWMGVHPVTQAQWRAVTGRNPSGFEGDTLPVELVRWFECRDFAESLSRQVGEWFRLPTEAEWEYACRAGTTTPFHFGETLGTDQANHNGQNTDGDSVYREWTTPVGGFPPNAWGLHDMHGNVAEWCQDEYAPYPTGEVEDPRVADASGVFAQRGGAWDFGPRACRSASRLWGEIEFNTYNVGCRVLLGFQG
jgi:uncharacterized protein (TIGR02996 family)